MQIIVVVAKYTSSSGLSARILHLKGEKIFGSTKHKVDLPPRLKVDSHWHDWVNFSRLKVGNPIALINQLSTMDVKETSGLVSNDTHNGVEVFKCLCGEGIWRIECCPQV